MGNLVQVEQSVYTNLSPPPNWYFYDWLEDKRKPSVIFLDVWVSSTIIHPKLGCFFRGQIKDEIPLFDKRGEYAVTLLLPPYVKRNVQDFQIVDTKLRGFIDGSKTES